MCFCQLIGIPVGSDPASFVETLFLNYFQTKGLPQTKRELRKSRIYKPNSFRFINDLCTLNNNKYLKIIKPNFIIMRRTHKKENENPCKAAFLDLSMEVHDKFTTEKFYKPGEQQTWSI